MSDKGYITARLKLDSNIDLRKAIQALGIDEDFIVLSARSQWIKVTRHADGIDVRHINGHSNSFHEGEEIDGYLAWDVITAIHRIQASQVMGNKSLKSTLDKIRASRLY